MSPRIPPISSLPLLRQASVSTVSAQRYLGQLCKHFAHKIAVDLALEASPPFGFAHFVWGDCLIVAQEDRLLITVHANDSAASERIIAVVDDHLRRFAWRETLEISWATPS